MGMALHPKCRNLSFIETLSELTRSDKAVVVREIRAKVWASITVLAENVTTFERAEAAKAASKSVSSDHDRRRQKRLKFTSSTSNRIVQEMTDSGVFDPDGGEFEDSDEDREATPAQEAAALVKQWRQAKLAGKYRVTKTGEDVATFWREDGMKHHMVMSVVVSSALGAPGSVAVPERDFGESGKLVSRQRGSLGAAYVEMMMYLRGAYDYIPETIPKLSDDEAADAIPCWLRDPRIREEVEGLVRGEDDDLKGSTLFCVDEDELGGDAEEEEGSVGGASS